ncbi:uncharacterized protein [Dermacentor albipictus]|uniref:uncharacterized protein n=1 Tax=Dermacentor albipictus TaxID=60249 RepID=UPI0038FBFE3C
MLALKKGVVCIPPQSKNTPIYCTRKKKKRLLVSGTIIDDIEEVFNKLKKNITENIPGTKVVPTSLGDLFRKFGIKANVSQGCPFEDDLCIVECYNNNRKRKGLAASLQSRPRDHSTSKKKTTPVPLPLPH